MKLQQTSNMKRESRNHKKINPLVSLNFLTVKSGKEFFVSCPVSNSPHSTLVALRKHIDKLEV